jgi:hypothetical protein
MVGPELHGLDRSLDAGICRQENDQDVLVELLDLPEDRDPVAVRQPIVQEDEIDAFGQQRQRGGAGLRLEDLVPLELEALAERPADQGFVVDDKNSGFVMVGSREVRGACRSL